MPPSPWVILSATQPERDYLVLLTYLPLKTFWKLPGFLRHAQAIRGQLAGARGAIGYAMLAQLMSALRGHMGETRFIEWQAAGATLPPEWDDAMARFRRENGA